MNYAEIKYNDIANGPGVRTSLFVSGCTHRCKGCFNEVAWDFNYGTPFTQETIDAIINSMKPAYIAGITLLGGEPFEPANQRGLLPLLKQVKQTYPDKNIWCFTGYLFDKDIMDKVDISVKNKFFTREICVCAHLTQTRYARKTYTEMRINI